jgi:hypothetical protein
MRLNLELIKVLLTAVAAGLALYTFWRNLKVRRAEWLASLYERFYLNADFKKIRAILDYDTPERAKLLKCLETEPENASALEPLVDYLNFFSFVASLWKLRQLKTGEVKMMFEYYIKNLARFPELMNFMRREGFKRLEELIGEIASA